MVPSCYGYTVEGLVVEELRNTKWNQYLRGISNENSGDLVLQVEPQSLYIFRVKAIFVGGFSSEWSEAFEVEPVPVSEQSSENQQSGRFWESHVFSALTDIDFGYTFYK